MTDYQSSLSGIEESEGLFEDFGDEDLSPLLNDGDDWYPTPPQPLDKEVSRRNPIADMHIYWSKKPYEAIQHFVEQLSEKGDVVLDGCSGSGMTGVASISKGRKFIGTDYSPAAVFLSKNVLAPITPTTLNQAYSELESAVKDRINDLYRVSCEDCGSLGTTNYVRWRHVYECKRCGNDVVATEDRKVSKATYGCDSCGADVSIGDDGKPIDRRPIEISYDCSCGSGRANQKEPTDRDKRLIEQANQRDIDYWTPDSELKLNSRIGVTNKQTVADLYTPRNLHAMAVLRDEIQRFDSPIRELLMFCFTSICFNTTIMYQDREAGGGVTKGTLYQPPQYKENNVWNIFDGKVSYIRRGLEEKQDVMGNFDVWETARVFQEDVRDLSRLDESSVDYIFIDPPYGDQVPYSEINLVWTAWLKDSEQFDDEIVITDSSEREEKQSEHQWQDAISETFEELYRVLKPGRWVTVTFNPGNMSLNAWEEFNRRIQDAGFLPYNGRYALDISQKTYKQLTESKAQKKDVIVNYYKLPTEAEEVEFETPPKETPQNIRELVETAIDNIVRDGYQGEGVYTDQVFHAVLTVLTENNALEYRPDWESILEEKYVCVEDQMGRDRWQPPDTTTEIDPTLNYYSEDLIARREIEEFLEDEEAATYTEIQEHLADNLASLPETSLGDILEDAFIKEYDRSDREHKWRIPETPEERARIERQREGQMESRIDSFVNTLSEDAYIDETPPLEVLEYGTRYLLNEERHADALLLFDYIDIDELPEDMRDDVRRRQRICQSLADEDPSVEQNSQGGADDDGQQQKLEDLEDDTEN